MIPPAIKGTPLKRVIQLGGLRSLSLSLMLLQNVLIVRFLTIEDIGLYYLLVTVAYLGNAAIFVGADLYLQRQLAHLSTNQPLDRAALARYMLLTAALGACVVLLASALYFSITASDDWLGATFICTALSVATYLSTLGRNLCQLANHPAYSNLGPVAEGLFRAVSLYCLAVIVQPQAMSVAVLSVIGALLGGATTFGLLLRTTRSRQKMGTVPQTSITRKCYLNSPRRAADAVLSVGASGVLNWAQLQGYRPILMNDASGTAPAVVGTVSFLSTLGSTAANAVFTILAQLQVPQQYRTQGASTRRYLLLLGFIALALSLASLPAGALFLWVSDKWQLLGAVYLVAVGVLLEAGNAAIGVCAHHMNAQGKTLWGLPMSGLVGCATTFTMLMAPVASDPSAAIAMALVAGQAIAVGIVLYLTFHPTQA